MHPLESHEISLGDGKTPWPPSPSQGQEGGAPRIETGTIYIAVGNLQHFTRDVLSRHSMLLVSPGYE